MNKKSLKTVAEGLKIKGFLKDIVGDEQTIIEGVAFDSRNLKKGDLFCCVVGDNTDGHLFAEDAIRSGAVALMCSRIPTSVSVPVLLVEDVRRAMGLVSSLLEGDPCRSMTLVSVTGTNGKSTTTYMIRSIMSQRLKVGLLGTIEYHDGDRSFKADRTTPEGPDIQALLGRMVVSGCDGCVMEASSHGISQGRLEGLSFDVAVFTNLTQEHLDYHGDMESYFKAKTDLFDSYMKDDSSKIFNLDDRYGRALHSRFPDGISYGIASDADVRADNLSLGVDGIGFDLTIEGSTSPVRIPIIGRYNVSNALAAAAACWSIGFSREEIVTGLEMLPAVPGRMERFVFDNGLCAVVDYAHSPDALENLLRSLRELCKGKLISVFGLGGERFRDNRWTMGEIAAKMADHLVLTMDNPRGEDPEDIVEDILTGVRKIPDASFEIVIEREKAVQIALDLGGAGDIVAISGKGPESYILIKGRKIPYSDSQAVVSWAGSRKRDWR
ncbi:UDP-N-acetylmuramoyl-L-alanyl-D-glutamate--2,6-diaminopimelate ligase [Dethiosulfovibrio salsuginis]|uniref:UDP-N-acetylmuramoyl-L-alanyl-D-glutamate--2,6-diaminopimelate ligase n=1 Tax=Dethiosulfovibrio salsuginis TaxID=561720 RepID=A0A1X7I7A6_9BACT|nr:UDP-N-acetylmuramoyl-L-alanyl-D-glutamate--2,6-diaminopimelate ligase [Dethiosulfovibrio salsuginis]SMG10008.1 UDP-N-acetylmuramoylalanyl-D-glutamate--2,6-diaminopimelate ligase [Dethiosulfovibrio salsuginis]